MRTTRKPVLQILVLGISVIFGNFSKSAFASTTVCLIPGQPALLSPPDTSGTSDNTPIFDWTDDPNASNYQIQVDDDVDFQSLAIDANSAISTFTPSTPLIDSNYFWRVRGINDTGGCNELGPWSEPNYLLISTASPFNISSNWAFNTPSVNGQITGSEWTEAASYDIHSPGPLINSQPTGETLSLLPSEPLAANMLTRSLEPSYLTAPEYLPVTLYIKNSESFLYLAIDNPNDTAEDNFDQMGIYFDDNPLPSDGQWTLSTCGNADGEGNFYIVHSINHPTIKVYRERIIGPTTCTDVIPAPGVISALGYSSGHLQVEAALDLQASALRAAPGDSINMYIWILDYSSQIFHGKWPLTGDFNDPSTFGSVTLGAITRTFLPLVFN